MNQIRPASRSAGWSADEFLAWEDRQEGKHEFDGTRIIPMTGGSWAHQRIVINIMFALMRRLEPDNFGLVQEMRLRIGRKVRYPDVCVTAGGIGQTVKTLADAIVLFEVLSDETANTDRVTKRAEYGEVPGLSYYVLLRQDAVGAIVHRRDGAGWHTETVLHTLALPGIGVMLPLAEIYAGLTFPA